MIYLASPYSHPDPSVREARFNAACLAAAQMIRAGQPVFAPIIQGHSLTQFGIPGNWPFWEPLARRYISRCDQVIVLQIDGWRESEGVRAEMALAAAMEKRVDYLETELRR
jgi:hypothetical protein